MGKEGKEGTKGRKAECFVKLDFHRVILRLGEGSRLARSRSFAKPQSLP
jgi:hypothetical protein